MGYQLSLRELTKCLRMAVSREASQDLENRETKAEKLWTTDNPLCQHGTFREGREGRQA